MINPHSARLSILYKGVLIGLLAGIVVNAYRYVLTEAEKLSYALYSNLHEHLQLIPLAFLSMGVIGYLVGIFVSHFPMISGSGIPQVSGTIHGYFRYSWLSTLLAKFFGGAVSILAGLSLGREGPSIQLGACVAQGIGNRFQAQDY
jgi:H+/Cl- antiporter ClcA